MTNKDFDIDEFVDELTGQVKNILPDDIGNKTQTFIEKMFDKFLRMANEAIDSNYSGLGVSVDTKAWLLQVLAEWTFHKTIDLDRANIPFGYWESILQKTAFAVFDVFQKGIFANLEQQVVLMGMEYHIKQMYNSSLQKLFEKGVITKEVLEKAQKESNFDKMSAEFQQKETKEQLKEADDLTEKMQDLVNPDRQYERLGADILWLQISSELLPITDSDQEGMLLPNTAALRQELTDTLGYIMPNCRLLDNSQLDSYEYRILVRQQTVGTGYVYPNRYMVNADEWEALAGDIPENAIIGVNPLNGESCWWVNKEDAGKYPSITALKPVTVMRNHLRQLVIRNVDSIISTYDIEKYFETANKIASSQNITEKLKERLEPEDIRQVFANLIKEEVSIKDILFVFDRLSDYSRTTKNPHILSEMLREDFARQISLKLADEDRTLYVVEFDKNYTKYLENNVKTTHNGQEFTIPQEQINELISATGMKLMLAHQMIGRSAIVLCSPKFRQAMYKTLERYLPFVKVISQAEVVSGVRVETLEIVELEGTDNYSEENIVDNEFYEQEPLLDWIIDSDGNPFDDEE